MVDEEATSTVAVLMLVPVAVSLDRNIAAEATGYQPGCLMARAAALMFVAPVCESFVPLHFYIVALPLCIFFFALLRSVGGNTGTNPALTGEALNNFEYLRAQKNQANHTELLQK